MAATTSLDEALDAFLQAYRRLLREAPDSGDPETESERRHFADLLDGVGAVTRTDAEPTSKPVCRFLDRAHVPPPSPLLVALATASRPLARQAVWRNKYRQIPGCEALFENFAFCDFIGPDGWRHSERVTLGLTMLGPHIDYPFHHHPARELYLLLSGVSDWAVDFQPHQCRNPGDWMLHREMQPHAMRSRGAPMLAVSAWRGDVRGRSHFSRVQTNTHQLPPDENDR